jgi:GNAT superfamily N-acetyltransferase
MPALANYVIRPATVQDKYKLQRLIWAFTQEESRDYELKLFWFMLKPFLVSCMMLALLIYLWFWQQLDPNLIRLATIVASFGMLLCGAALVQYLAYLLAEAWFNWPKYWVIELVESTATSDRQLIGCAALAGRSDYKVIYQLYVAPAYRRLGLGSQLAQRLLAQAAPMPVYLVCKPKMQAYYARFKFEQVDWHDLPEAIKPGFRSFKPEGIYPLQIMCCNLNLLK